MKFVLDGESAASCTNSIVTRNHHCNYQSIAIPNFLQQNHSLLKLHTTRRERALGALNGTLLLVSHSASHRKKMYIVHLYTSIKQERKSAQRNGESRTRFLLFVHKM